MKKIVLAALMFIIIQTILFPFEITKVDAMPSLPAAEVVYRYGSTDLVNSDFENSVSQIINDQISSAGISSKTVIFSNLLSTKANAADKEAWTIYGHGNVDWPSTYPGGGTFTPPQDRQHIQVSDDGANMTFYGYTSPPYNDFMLYNNDVAGEKTFKFTLDGSQIYYHSMLGGGFLFNATADSGKLSGYLVLFTGQEDSTSGTISLYQLDNVDIDNLHEGLSGSLTSIDGVKILKSSPRNTNDPKIIDVTVVVSSDNKFSLTTDGGEKINYELPSVYGNRFGPFASFASHGCTDVSIFGFKNLEMSISKTETFPETLNKYSWSKATFKYFVNIDDDSSAYAADPTAGAIIAELNDNEVYYIGVGKASNAEASQQFNKESEGTYFLTSDEDIYANIGVQIAKDIINNYKLSNLTATAGDHQVILAFSPPVGALDGDLVLEQSTDGAIFVPVKNQEAITSGSAVALVTDMENGQTYWLRLNIGSGQYQGYSNIVTVTPAASIENIRNHGKGDRYVPIVINGQTESAGARTEKVDNGINNIMIDINEKTISEKIDEMLRNSNTTNETKNIVEISVDSKIGETVKVGLNGELVKKMEIDSFALKVTSNNVSYIIQSKEIKISDLSKGLGAGGNLDKIELQIVIIQPSAETVAQILQKALDSHYAPVIAPIDFEIIAFNTTTKETKPISKFDSYVLRIFEIPPGVDPSRITTGISYINGTFSHVPTEIVNIDGRYYAKLNSLTNSIYSVVWNPVKVASVEYHWSKEAVNDMASRLIINNPGTFNPDEIITRGEFAEYITKALGIYRTGVAKDGLFTDVKKTDEYADAIQISAEYGIVDGYNDGSFRPNASISRQEAMVMYSRAMNILNLVSADVNRINNYTDRSSVAPWAAEDVRKAVGANVFNGVTDSQLNPTGILTKAEAITAIRNLLIASKLINH